MSRLYRARWQIELVYKRLKQLLKLGRVASKQREMVEATIPLRLIAWALQEEEASQLRAQLALAAEEPAQPVEYAEEVGAVEEADMVEAQEQECARETQSELVEQLSYEGPISTWLLTSLCLDCLTQQVRGSWTAARLRACLSRLRRFCGSSPRRRIHQETSLRAWLAPPRSQAGMQVTLFA